MKGNEINMKRNEISFRNSILSLERYIKDCNYSGYDPYDALNSKKIKSIRNKFIRILFTQLFVYSPINLRRFFKISPDRNPKAIGLLLQAYCKLFKIGLVEEIYFKSIYEDFVNYLMENSSKGYSGYCWGFNFPWQDPTRFSDKGLPTIVITAYVANSFLDLYEITREKRYLDISRSSCKFMLNDLNITELENGVCFSYTPIDKHIVHNANLLGAALLARVYSITKERTLLEYSKKAFDFSLSHQNEDGSWAYSLRPDSRERKQIDFHQGFILDSIHDFIKYTCPSDEKYESALLKGAEFYMNEQFDDKGRSKWRLPWSYPVDIHNQAQGIITFSKLYEQFKDKRYLEFALKIANWTIEYMQDETGYFYYQKWPLFTNKIPYMRWGQAWMLLALSSLMHNEIGG